MLMMVVFCGVEVGVWEDDEDDRQRDGVGYMLLLRGIPWRRKTNASGHVRGVFLPCSHSVA